MSMRGWTVLLRKEFQQFFASLTGYIAMGFFLVVSALIVWILPETSILDRGYAGLDPFFQFAPWLLILLTAVITGRQLAEEKRLQTLELLLTRPVSVSGIVLGKFLATWFLLLLALAFTIPFVPLVGWLATPRWNLDLPAIAGSYVGLWLMCGAFTAVGVFISALTPNQVVSFLASATVSFLLFYGLYALANLPFVPLNVEWWLEWMSMYFHYQSLARGVVDSRDVVYFCSVMGLFLFWTQLILEARR